MEYLATKTIDGITFCVKQGAQELSQRIIVLAELIATNMWLFAWPKIITKVEIDFVEKKKKDSLNMLEWIDTMSLTVYVPKEKVDECEFSEFICRMKNNRIFSSIIVRKLLL